MQQIKQRCKGLLALALSIMIGLTMMPVSAKAAEDELEYRLLTWYAHEYGEDYRYYVESYPEITVKSGTTAKELGADTGKTGLSVAEQEEIVGWNIWKTDSSGYVYNEVSTVITTIYDQETLNEEDWEKAFYIHSSGSYTHVPVLEPVYHSHSIDTTVWKNNAKQHWHGCKETSTYIYGVQKAENGEKENLVPNTLRTDYTCEEVFDNADHVAAEGYEHNTDAHWQTCDVCGFVLNKADHVTAEGYEYNSDTHWQICDVCNTLFNKAEHSWDSGAVTTPATTEKEGVKTYTCTVCKATKTEAVPKTVKPTTPTTPTKQSLSKAQITGLSSKTYNGKAQTQSKLKVICEGKTLKQGTDYTVSYKNNTKAGTATVTVSGKGNYTGSKDASFTIKKAAQSISKVSGSYTKAYKTNFTLSPKAKGKISYKSSNTKVATVNSKGKVSIKGTGKVTITVSAKATSCYKAASKKVTIYAVPAKAKLKEVKSAKGKVEAEWKKDSNASGYQVLYSTDKKMKKAKTMNCNKKDTTATIKNLKKNKTCYVKVRAYKTIDGKKYSGAYSDKMSVKVK